jgi:hypothetical protein
MEFEIPEAASLPRFTVAALRDLGLEAAAAFDALRDAVTPENVTEEDLDNLEDLKAFMVLCDDELARRPTAASTLSRRPGPRRLWITKTTSRLATRKPPRKRPANQTPKKLLRTLPRQR